MENPPVETQPQPQSQPEPQPRELTAQPTLSSSQSVKRKPVANTSRPNTAVSTTATTTPAPAPPPTALPAAREIQDPEKLRHVVTTLTGTYSVANKPRRTRSSSSSSSTTTPSIPTTEKELATYTAAYTYTPNPDSKSELKYNAPLPALPPTTNTSTTTPRSTTLFVHRLKRKFLTLHKRTRYLILAALLALIILIIGLAAGLTARSRNKFKNLPLPNSHGGPVTGDLTYYDPGLGACGVTSTSSDFIVAVSHVLFDAVQAGSNVNGNPLCGKKIRARRGETSVDLTVVDRCTGCQPQDIDVTRTIFGGLADIDQGRVSVTWAWLEDVPSGVTES